MKEQKLKAISNYFKTNFPNEDHAGKFDFDRFSYLFRITTKDHILLASVSEEFIEDNSQETIISKLKDIDICKLLIENPKLKISVTGKGVSIIPRN
ncbi:MAG: hypothetical protein K4571_14880 [Deltaproteobacteria bacterium]